MRRRHASLAAATLLTLVPFELAHAQVRVRPRFAAGFISPATDIGLQLGGALELSETNRPLRFRGEILIQDSEVRDLLSLGSVVLARPDGVLRPYVLAGAGVYFDNGTPMALAAGAGLELHELTTAPVFVEARIVQTRDAYVMLSFGVELTRPH